MAATDSQSRFGFPSTPSHSLPPLPCSLDPPNFLVPPPPTQTMPLPTALLFPLIWKRVKNTYSVRYGHKKVHFRLRELGMWAAEAASMYIAQSRNLGNVLQIEVSVEFVANFGGVEIGEEEGEHGSLLEM